jgi:hypothetical protein
MKKLILLFLLSANCYATNWECTNRVLTCHTWRMEVPTGWIVASDNSASGGEHGYAMVFVPDTGHTWKL